ncbi:MAG: hypothetical protein IKP66_01205 [Lachnospiraceae bacterium]|nr:hypothetical protein [Lachnospiraceae bacterium]
MLKKILSVVLSIAMIFTLFACGSNSSISSDGSSSGGSNSSLRAQIENCTPLVDYSGNTTIDEMDSIEFGKDEKGRSIEWVVLEKGNNKALLITKWLLYQRNYHNEYVNITWENSLIRKWLNSDFLDLSFNKKEQGQILTTNVINNDNVEYNTSGGNDTKDKVFLLSLDETSQYFKSGRQIVSSYKDDGEPLTTSKGDAWGDNYWLRSPGGSQSSAAGIRLGIVDYAGWGVFIDDTIGFGIRPAMWVKY